jgi:hypothetical protein
VFATASSSSSFEGRHHSIDDNILSGVLNLE